MCVKLLVGRTRIGKREVRGFHVYSVPKMLGISLAEEDPEMEVISMVFHLKNNVKNFPLFALPI